MEKIIYQKLQEALTPDKLLIQNESHLHEGHSGSPHSGESHFSIHIVSSQFENLNRIQRHQKIYKVLEQELETKIHALAIRAEAPE